MGTPWTKVSTIPPRESLSNFAFSISFCIKIDFSLLEVANNPSNELISTSSSSKTSPIW